MAYTILTPKRVESTDGDQLTRADPGVSPFRLPLAFYRATSPAAWLASHPYQKSVGAHRRGARLFIPIPLCVWYYTPRQHDFGNGALLKSRGTCFFSMSPQPQEICSEFLWDAAHTGQAEHFSKTQGGAVACPGLEDLAPSGRKAAPFQPDVKSTNSGPNGATSNSPGQACEAGAALGVSEKNDPCPEGAASQTRRNFAPIQPGLF